MEEKEKAKKYIEYNKLDYQFLRCSKKGNYLFGKSGGKAEDRGAEQVISSVPSKEVEEIVKIVNESKRIETKKQLAQYISTHLFYITNSLPQQLRVLVTWQLSENDTNFNLTFNLTDSDLMFDFTNNPVILPKNLCSYQIDQSFKKVNLVTKKVSINLINKHLTQLRWDDDKILAALKTLKPYLKQFDYIQHIVNTHQYFTSSKINKEEILVQSVFHGQQLTLNCTEYKKKVIVQKCEAFIEKILKPYYTLLKQEKAVIECVTWLNTLSVIAKSIKIIPKVKSPHIEFQYKIGKKSFKTRIDVAEAYKRNLKNQIKKNQEIFKHEQKEQEVKIRSNVHYGNLLDCELIALVKEANNQCKDITESSAIKIMRGLSLQSNWYDSVKDAFDKTFGGANFAYIPSIKITKHFRKLKTDALLKSKTKRGEYGSFDVYEPTELGLLILEASKAEKRSTRSDYALIAQLHQYDYYSDLDNSVKTLTTFIDRPTLFCVCQEVTDRIIKAHPDRCKSYLNIMSILYKDDTIKKKIINVMKKMVPKE